MPSVPYPAPRAPDDAPLQAGRLAIACLIYALFIVYGSLVPLDYQPRAWAEAWAAFQQIPYLRLGVASRADWVANILLYIPIAFLGAGAVASVTRSRTLRVAGVIVVAAACIALAVVVEFAQLFFPPRTVSQNDLIAETIGTVIGITLWLVAGDRLSQLWRALAAGGVHSWQAFAALYAIAYLAYSLFPYLIVDRMTIWQAAAAPESLRFVFVGVCFVLPLIVAYTVIAYRVFWGKARSLTYHA